MSYTRIKALLGLVEVAPVVDKTPEHWTQWIARKCYKSAFSRRVNRSSCQPKTNTPGLYDGSVEARAIVKNALDVEKGDGDGKVVVADGILLHVMAYLKGRDVPMMGMWTSEAVGYGVDNCQICHGEEGGELGNENIIGGVRVCDFCHSAMLSGLIDFPEWGGNLPFTYLATKMLPKSEVIQIKPISGETNEQKGL